MYPMKARLRFLLGLKRVKNQTINDEMIFIIFLHFSSIYLFIFSETATLTESALVFGAINTIFMDGDKDFGVMDFVIEAQIFVNIIFHSVIATWLEPHDGQIF